MKEWKVLPLESKMIVREEARELPLSVFYKLLALCEFKTVYTYCSDKKTKQNSHYNWEKGLRYQISKMRTDKVT